MGFWDASALVALCVPGLPQRRLQTLLRDYPPVVWWGTRVEIASALARLRREAVLTPAHYEASRRRLQLLADTWREILPTEPVRDLADREVERHELRTGDAFQLAAALVWCRGFPRRRPFLSNDRRLNRAARAEGFLVIEV